MKLAVLRPVLSNQKKKEVLKKKIFKAKGQRQEHTNTNNNSPSPTPCLSLKEVCFVS